MKVVELFVTGIAVIAICLAGYSWYSDTSVASILQTLSRSSHDVETKQSIGVTQDDYVFGNTDGKVNVVVYSDTECKYCIPYKRKIFDLFREDSELRVTYKFLDLASYPHSFDEAKILWCATKDDKRASRYSEVVEVLYEIDSMEGFDYGETVGKLPQWVNRTELSACFNDRMTDEVLTAQSLDGYNAGVTMLPTTFFYTKNGKVLKLIGNEDTEVVKTFITAAKAQ